MKRALFIINPNAGKMLMRSHLMDVLNKFSANDFECTVYITQKANDATEYIMNVSSKYDIIISCGGDGTFNEVLKGVYQHPEITEAISCIPAGTVNDFANSLGIPNDIPQAADVILNSSKHKYDFGLFNGNIFSYVAAAGAFTEISYSTPQYLKNLFGKYAYYFEGARKLGDISQSFHLKIEIDDKVYEGDYIFIAISNSKSIGGLLQFEEDKSILRDGKFELLLIKTPQSPLDLQKIMSAIKFKTYDNEVIHCLHGREFKIYADNPLPWTVDGEYAGAFSETSVAIFDKKISLVYPE